jgi:hypothetical protein
LQAAWKIDFKDNGVAWLVKADVDVTGRRQALFPFECPSILLPSFNRPSILLVD